MNPRISGKAFPQDALANPRHRVACLSVCFFVHSTMRSACFLTRREAGNKFYKFRWFQIHVDFTVIIEKDEDGYYVAEVPDLKGCYTQGKTLEEVMKNIREVIKLCLESEKGHMPRKELVGVQRIEVTA